MALIYQTIDRRIPTMPERSTPDIHRPGRNCQAHVDDLPSGVETQDRSTSNRSFEQPSQAHAGTVLVKSWTGRKKIQSRQKKNASLKLPGSESANAGWKTHYKNQITKDPQPSFWRHPLPPIVHSRHHNHHSLLRIRLCQTHSTMPPCEVLGGCSHPELGGHHSCRPAAACSCITYAFKNRTRRR